MILKDEKFLDVVTELVRSAHYCIDITTFKAEMTHKPRGRKLMLFWEALFDKQREGKRVRIMFSMADLRRHIPDSNRFAVRALKSNHIEVRALPDSRVVHAKLLLIDTSVAVIGSHNLSVKSCCNNFEVSLMVANAAIVHGLQGVYNDTFEKGVKV